MYHKTSQGSHCKKLGCGTVLFINSACISYFTKSIMDHLLSHCIASHGSVWRVLHVKKKNIKAKLTSMLVPQKVRNMHFHTVPHHDSAEQNWHLDA